MVKIRYAKDDTDPSRRMVDILRHSRLKSEQTLSVETIINLAEGGVPVEEFLKLQSDSLKALIEPYLEWDDPDVCTKLGKRISDGWSIFSARRTPLRFV